MATCAPQTIRTGESEPAHNRKEDMTRLVAAPAAIAALLASTAIAQAQGSINVFNWSDYIADGILEEFTARTGIAANYDVFDSNDTLEARMLAGASGFDVVVPTSDYMQRQIAAGIYQPLNKDLLPNLVHMDPALMELAAAFDPGNAHGIIYLWGTTGIGYNRAAVDARMGEGFEVTSWSLIFDPAIISRFADCGVAVLDAPTELLPPALRFLGLEPTSTAEADLNAAAELIASIRPHIRYFHSSQYISDLANGEICLAVGWSGDILQAAARAEEAGQGVSVNYAIPVEGAHLWFDMLVIPRDAPNPEGAHAFINFLMDPEIAARNTNYVQYPNANLASRPFIDEAVLNDPTIYPTDETIATSWTLQPYDSRTDRIVSRLWTRLRTGQ
jgi:putrescine transport system substrate-binding protein